MDPNAVLRGSRIRALRNELGMTVDQVASGTKGLLDRSRIVRIENGKDKMRANQPWDGLSASYLLSRPELESLANGVITAGDAAKIVRSKTTQVASADPLAAPSKGVLQEGERLAVLSQLAHSSQAPFPNLEVCVLYHLRSGKVWSPGTLAAARAGTLGEEDKTPKEWEGALDRLETLHHSLFEPRLAARSKTLKE